MDNTLFSEAELQAISQALGDTENGLSNSQIDELLQLCKVPDAAPGSAKWKRIYYSLWNRQVEQGSRTTTLAFMRKAMKPPRHLRDPERAKTLRVNLNTALAFAGLAFNDRGELHTSKRIHTLDEAKARARELRGTLEARGVHPRVLAFCKAELLDENYFHAVLEATKSIFERLRELSRVDTDGGALVDTCLSGSTPLLAINGLTTESERSEQKGFANLLKGTYGMFRNPTAHAPRKMWTMDKTDAEDLLSLASLVHRRLDNSRRLQ